MNLNPYFVETMNLCISKVLDKDLINQGFSTQSHDAINDITQHCDHMGLKTSLIELCDSLIEMMMSNILG